MMDIMNSSLWLNVQDKIDHIFLNLHNITGAFDQFDHPIADYIKDSTNNVVREYRDYLTDWRFYIVVLIILIVFFKNKSYKKKRKIDNTVYADGPPRSYNEDSDSHLNIFDIAKTGYEEGHTEYIKSVVESTNYDVNYQPTSAHLSLFLCGCLSGNEKLIRYLLHKGGDVLAVTEDGDSPLYLATFGVLNSESPNTNVIKLLLRAGCKVNQQNKKGFTPLHRAASKGNIDIVKCLLHYGADQNICNNAGVYPLDSAINAGHIETAELLCIAVENPHVWDVVEPHTPTHITLGLQSPQRKLLMESSRPKHHVIEQ